MASRYATDVLASHNYQFALLLTDVQMLPDILTGCDLDLAVRPGLAMDSIPGGALGTATPGR